MKTLLATVVALVTCLYTKPSFAVDWLYMGFSGGSFKYGSIYGAVNTKSGGPLIDITLTRHLALEFDYHSTKDQVAFYLQTTPNTSLGTLAQSTVDIRSESVVGVSLLGYFPVRYDIGLVARTGIAPTRLKIDVENDYGPCTAAPHGGCDYSVKLFHNSDATKVLPVVGVGISWQMPGRFKLGLEYDRMFNFGDNYYVRHRATFIGFNFSLSVRGWWEGTAGVR